MFKINDLALTTLSQQNMIRMALYLDHYPREDTDTLWTHIGLMLSLLDSDDANQGLQSTVSTQ